MKTVQLILAFLAVFVTARADIPSASDQYRLEHTVPAVAKPSPVQKPAPVDERHAFVATSAEYIRLADGRVLRNAIVISESPASVTIRHDHGMAQVAKAALPEALRLKYPVDQTAVELEKMRDERVALNRQAEVKLEGDKIAKQRARDFAERTPEKQSYSVEYQISGRVNEVNITYNLTAGRTSQKRIKPNGGWSESFTAYSGDFLYLSGQLPGTTSETTFKIKVNGEEVRSVVANGSYSIGTVSMRLE